MRLFLFFLFFFSAIAAQAQPSDFIILKKKNKTIHSYYAGTQIEFVTTNGIYKDAVITKIANDTIYLQEFLVRQLTAIFAKIDVQGFDSDLATLV